MTTVALLYFFFAHFRQTKAWFYPFCSEQYHRLRPIPIHDIEFWNRRAAWFAKVNNEEQAKNRAYERKQCLQVELALAVIKKANHELKKTELSTEVRERFQTARVNAERDEETALWNLELHSYRLELDKLAKDYFEKKPKT